MKTLITVVISSLLLSACASGGWSHPSNTEANFRSDSFRCEREALAMYPVQMQQQGVTYTTPEKTNCQRTYNGVTCTTTPASTSGGYQADVNRGSRNRAEESCLRSLGYVWSKTNPYK